uniref:Putative leucine rich repeat-containing n=1 Tax=Schistosoma mansoni TaxID=6183 RepID=A0A3Q0KNQ3_SCHMA
MGKKSAKDKSPKVGDLHITSDPKDYVVTGNLENDFHGLCKQSGVTHCPVVSTKHSQAIITQTVSSLPSSKRSKDDKKSPQSQNSSVTKYSDEIQPPLGFNPTTFKLCKTLEYLKPKIIIQQENPDKPETVNEVSIKGWKISNSQLDVLIKCFSVANKLSKLVFWRVGFTAEQITQLASFLSTNNTIKSLTIDANEALEIGSYAQLIDESNNLTKLRLRYCEIGPMEAKSISQRLGTMQYVNKKLINLDLSGNQLGDEGTIYLAEALRTNRTLLTLSVSNNKITDIGCIALAKVISQFFLTHEEIVYRRLCQSEKSKSESIPLTSSPLGRRKSKVSPSARDASKESTQGVSGAKKRDKSVRGRNAKDIDSSKDDKSGGKGKKSDSSNSPKKANQEQNRSSGKSKTGRNTRSAKQTSDTERLESSPETNELINPILDKAIYVEPYGLLIVGNFILAFLNLSRNSIGINGLKALLEAITYQVNLLNVENATLNLGTGILTLLFDDNAFNPDCEMITSIHELLASRDPTARIINNDKILDSELSNSNVKL